MSNINDTTKQALSQERSAFRNAISSHPFTAVLAAMGLGAAIVVALRIFLGI